jgi:hypothetical protein
VEAYRKLEDEYKPLDEKKQKLDSLTTRLVQLEQEKETLAIAQTFFEKALNNQDLQDTYLESIGFDRNKKEEETNKPLNSLGVEGQETSLEKNIMVDEVENTPKVVDISQRGSIYLGRAIEKTKIVITNLNDKIGKLTSDIENAKKDGDLEKVTAKFKECQEASKVIDEHRKKISQTQIGMKNDLEAKIKKKKEAEEKEKQKEPLPESEDSKSVPLNTSNVTSSTPPPPIPPPPPPEFVPPAPLIFKKKSGGQTSSTETKSATSGSPKVSRGDFLEELKNKLAARKQGEETAWADKLEKWGVDKVQSASKKSSSEKTEDGTGYEPVSSSQSYYQLFEKDNESLEKIKDLSRQLYGDFEDESVSSLAPAPPPPPPPPPVSTSLGSSGPIPKQTIPSVKGSGKNTGPNQKPILDLNEMTEAQKKLKRSVGSIEEAQNKREDNAEKYKKELQEREGKVIEFLKDKLDWYKEDVVSEKLIPALSRHLGELSARLKEIKEQRIGEKEVQLVEFLVQNVAPFLQNKADRFTELRTIEILEMQVKELEKSISSNSEMKLGVLLQDYSKYCNELRKLDSASKFDVLKEDVVKALIYKKDFLGELEKLTADSAEAWKGIQNKEPEAMTIKEIQLLLTSKALYEKSKPRVLGGRDAMLEGIRGGVTLKSVPKKPNQSDPINKDSI